MTAQLLAIIQNNLTIYYKRAVYRYGFLFGILALALTLLYPTSIMSSKALAFFTVQSWFFFSLLLSVLAGLTLSAVQYNKNTLSVLMTKPILPETLVLGNLLFGLFGAFLLIVSGGSLIVLFTQNLFISKLLYYMFLLWLHFSIALLAGVISGPLKGGGLYFIFNPSVFNKAIAGLAYSLNTTTDVYPLLYHYGLVKSYDNNIVIVLIYDFLSTVVRLIPDYYPFYAVLAKQSNPSFTILAASIGYCLLAIAIIFTIITIWIYRRRIN